MVPLFNEKHGAGVGDEGLNLSSDEDKHRQRTSTIRAGWLLPREVKGQREPLQKPLLSEGATVSV